VLNNKFYLSDHDGELDQIAYFTIGCTVVSIVSRREWVVEMQVERLPKYVIVGKALSILLLLLFSLLGQRRDDR
jgi:hypothetical protein